MTRQQRASLTLSLLAVRPCGGDRTAGAGLAWVSPAAPRIFAWPVWWWDDRRLRHIYIHFALCVSPVSHPQAQVNGFLWRLLYARWPFMRARVCSGLSAMQGQVIAAFRPVFAFTGTTPQRPTVPNHLHPASRCVAPTVGTRTTAYPKIDLIDRISQGSHANP